MMNWTKVETGEPRRDGSSRSRNCTVKERERPSSATYSWASAIAFVVTSTGTGPLVVMETSSPSRTRPAIAPASLKQSVLSLTVRSSSDGSRSMISAARCSSYETFDDWRMSPSKVGLMTISTGPPLSSGSSCRYLRAMAMALHAWLRAAGPVASRLGSFWPSRTMLQIAPATELGFDSPDTLSFGLSDAASSETDAPLIVPTASPSGALLRWYGALERALERRGGLPPRTTPPLPRLDCLMTSSRAMSTPVDIPKHV
mmetsp:Transcript_40717/g.121441  ORF Transcript_40717/g.121441 Transcript_40717/m.121441 type:complete len:258 (+) Transcript_40717:391-1164(+)